MAYQGLDRYENAMTAYAEGLVADPKQGSMLHGLIEAMLKSPYRGKHTDDCGPFEWTLAVTCGLIVFI